MSDCGIFLESAGISDPLTKIYVTTKKLQHLSISVFFFVLSQLTKLSYSKGVGSLIAKKPTDLIDGAPFVCGVITLLKQFHSTHTHNFLALVGQYVRAHVGESDPKVFIVRYFRVRSYEIRASLCHFVRRYWLFPQVNVARFRFDPFLQKLSQCLRSLTSSVSLVKQVARLRKFTFRGV